MPVPVLLKAVFGATLVISASEAVPKLDVTASCRAAAKVNEALGLTESQRTDRCMHDEETFGDPTYADAILDRLVHNAHRIELTGESMRRTRGKQNQKA
jgi:hypothetical protein